MAETNKKPINRYDIKDPDVIQNIETWIDIGNELRSCIDLEDLFTYITSPFNLISEFLTEDFLNDFEGGDDFFDDFIERLANGDVDDEEFRDDGESIRRIIGRLHEQLLNKLLVHIVGERISYFYIKESRHKGIMSGGINSFFDAVTTKKQSLQMLCEVFGVSDKTIKNRRNDKFKDLRGPAKTETIDGVQYIYRVSKLG